MFYISLLLVVILVNVLPALTPPTWIVLVLFLVEFKLNLWVVVLIGVVGATAGRFILSQYILWFSKQIFNKKQEENLQYLGNKIGNTKKTNILFTFLYSLTPLSTNALFVAAGIARVRILYVLIGFFFGRLVSYTLLALSTKAIAVNISELLNGIVSPESLLSTIAGSLILLFFIFIDWKKLLDERKIKLNFNIWKWNEVRE